MQGLIVSKMKVALAYLLAFVLVCSMVPIAGPACAQEAVEPETFQDGIQVQDEDPAADVEEILGKMTTDEKISQLIIPAIRTWNKANVTNLTDVPELAEALKRHQYGGIILFAQNVVDSQQTAQLVEDLQANNAVGNFSSNIPYLMPVDEEGGVVVRFGMGTRTTGSMAVGATGANAEWNAYLTGQILGQECAALGFNVDLAPSVDVNNNPANPIIGVRSFSDDPEVVGRLGAAFSCGVVESQVVPAFKHFPGHGDTDTDTHLATATIDKTAEELEACELVPFRANAGEADLVMTAHITLPKYDDEQVFADGTTGFLPATMSHKVLTDLLRNDMGFKGVVITDALEMDAIQNIASAVSESDDFVVQRADIAQRCIEAGVDILLLPLDLNGTDGEVNRVEFYDSYIGTLAKRADEDADLMARVNQSVERILRLKEKYGILKAYKTRGDLGVVGSAAHHETEMQIARQAVTLIKNDAYTLPISGHRTNIVLLGRDKDDNVSFANAIRELQGEGLVDQDAHVVNLVTGKATGPENAATSITIDYYYDSSNPTEAHLTDDLMAAISHADVVVALTKNWGLSTLQPNHSQYKGVAQTCEAAHKAGGKFVLMCGNLPYDSARYPQADAIVCSYMSSGIDIDSTTRQDGSTTTGAFNANALAAVESMFDYAAPAGKLPVRIPAIKTAENGSVTYDVETTLYERGLGLGFEYAFVKGAGSVYTRGSSKNLVFEENARFDKLTGVAVDGKALKEGQYAAEFGSTRITLNADYLDTLAPGEHTLAASHDYGANAFDVETTFTVQEGFTTTFNDVTSETDCADDINWLHDAQIAQGWDNPDGTKSFRPYSGIARSDMAAFLFRLAVKWDVVEKDWQPTKEQKTVFADVSNESKVAHAREVWWLAATGISQGWEMEDRTKRFRPYETVKRQDMAAFLFRLAKIAGRGGADDEWRAAEETKAKLSDVDPKSESNHHNEVWWLVETGVSQGWNLGDGMFEFRGMTEVKRCDMAALLHRMDSLPTSDE